MSEFIEKTLKPAINIYRRVYDIQTEITFQVIGGTTDESSAENVGTQFGLSIMWTKFLNKWG